MISVRSGIKKLLSEGTKAKYNYLKSKIRKRYRSVRVGKSMTNILGQQFSRSRKFIEIDITYSCNLSCESCNRSCSQARSKEHLDIDQIEKFIQASVDQRIKWQRIRLLGGEPSLHPNFFEILDLLKNYRASHSKDTILTITTNGFGKRVNSVLDRIQDDILIVNTCKISFDPATFYSFNLAPLDLPEYSNCDYSNGCDVIRDCGIGLTPFGYYPCGVSGSIDRVFGFNLGRKELPEKDDDMLDMLRVFCRYCGRFKYNRSSDTFVSESWEEAYRKYKVQKPALSQY